jgi:acylphosphatase
VADAPIARRYYVSGFVQGVGYRCFARREAMRLDLKGYTRNLRDGRVEVYVIGRERDVEALRAELEHGPQAASVAGVTAEEASVDSRLAEGFSIQDDV